MKYGGNFQTGKRLRCGALRCFFPTGVDLRSHSQLGGAWVTCQLVAIDDAGAYTVSLPPVSKWGGTTVGKSEATAPWDNKVHEGGPR